MKEEELQKHIEHELQFLRYYANRESRISLAESSDLYSVLYERHHPGFTNTRILPLTLKCAPCMITSNTAITKNSSVDDVFETKDSRDIEKNVYTPLEAFWIMFPKRRIWVISVLTLH